MTSIKKLVLTVATALVLTACDNATDPGGLGKAPAAPTVDALLKLERSAFEAWKSKDATFWDTFLSDGFVGYGSSGRVDKASAIKENVGGDCEVRSYALSDEQMKPLGADAALFTFKATVDATCEGQKVPASSRAATVFVREGDRWKVAFHAEAPIVDPAAAAAKPVIKKAVASGSLARDPGTDALFELEKTLWEAWRAHDAGRMEALTATDVSFINIFGTYFPTKADALKDWTGTGCEVQSVAVTDPAGTMISPTVGILLFNGAADGTCYGQTVGPIWGTSVYTKDGDSWKWTFGINLPAASEGA